MKLALITTTLAFAGLGGIAHAQTADTMEADTPVVLETETTETVVETTDVEPVTNAEYADEVEFEADEDASDEKVEVELEADDEE